MPVFEYEKCRVTVSEPTVVLRGEPWEKVHWGAYQFPVLTRTREGFLRYTCNGPDAQDNIEGYEGEFLPFGRVSEDEGKTWRPITVRDEPMGLKMANGRAYFPPKPTNAYYADWIDRYTPDFAGTLGSPEKDFGDSIPNRYDADRIPEYPRTPEAYEYDPATGQKTAFRMNIVWPHLAVLGFHRRKGTLVYPIESLMGIMGHTVVDADGTMFFATYQRGFSAETGKPSLDHDIKVLRSDDNGRNWVYQSEVCCTEAHNVHNGHFNGFCEPRLARVPDGSMIMLMRSGSFSPSFIVRSTDNCKSWSEPVMFDTVGVFPQVLSLKCGVTIATYGRAGVYLRATADPHGMAWEQPIDLGVPKYWEGSCCYTSILEVDAHTAFIAYSHFEYPDENGQPLKTLLLRKVTAEMR